MAEWFDKTCSKERALGRKTATVEREITAEWEQILCARCAVVVPPPTAREIEAAISRAERQRDGGDEPLRGVTLALFKRGSDRWKQVYEPTGWSELECPEPEEPERNARGEVVLRLPAVAESIREHNSFRIVLCPRCTRAVADFIRAGVE